jgi:acyl carrier protein
MTTLNDRDALDSIVRQILLQRLAVSGHPDSDLAQGTRLLELGLIDSEDLVEVILEVEENYNCEFDPTKIDLESGLTLAGFVSSFSVRG